MATELDTFGAFVMQHLRDEALDYFDGLTEAKWKAPSLKRLQEDLAALAPAERSVTRRCLLAAIDAGVHGFLFSLQEQQEEEHGIRVLADGQDVADVSDGLHGEPFGDDGWQARFSKYGVAPEQA